MKKQEIEKQRRFKRSKLEQQFAREFLSEEQLEKYTETRTTLRGEAVVFIKNGIRFRLDNSDHST